MKLQTALDCSSIEQALELMKKIHPYVDIIEIVTCLGLVEGFSALGKMKKAHPDMALCFLRRTMIRARSCIRWTF